MLYEFEPSHNTAAEVTNNIYCAKGEGAFDHSRVTWWLKKIRQGYKNLDDQ